MLKNLIKAKVTPIIIEADEPERVYNFIPENLDFNITGIWTASKGLELKCGNISYSNSPKNKDIESAFEYLRYANKQHFIIFINPPEIENINKHCLVFVGQGLKNLKGALYYTLPSPTKEEYEKEFTLLLKPKKDKKLIKKWAGYSCGMLLNEAKNCFKYSIYSESDFLSNKSKFINKKIIEEIRTAYRFNDVGGFNNFKEWFNKRKFLYKKEAVQFGLEFPKGVILAGIPGTGKGLVTKAMANEAGLPLFKLDLSTVYNQYAGVTDMQLREALVSIEQHAPCILWLDEFSRFIVGKESEGDSGLTSRVYAILLNWLQEREKFVFVSATVNDFYLLPPELIRKGRFSEVFGIGYPTLSDLCDIWAIHLKRKGINADMAFLSEISENMTGADIENVVNDALINCYNEGGTKEDISALFISNLIKPLEKNQNILNQIKGLRGV